MKIGIVTFHCSYNFGSALQAYAMQTVLEKMGHEAVIVDYRSSDFDRYKLIKIGRPRTMLGLLRRYPSAKKRKESFEVFWAERFHMTKDTFSYRDEEKLLSLANEFDCFLCGSDQIWNLDCTHGAVGPYFLDFAGDCRRVAYAPSLAHTAFEPENFNRDLVSGYLSRFDYLSVREAETVPLFQPLTNKPISVVLDPTVLLDREDYLPLIGSPLVQGSYIFAYQLRKCPELVDSVRLMAKRTGSRVIYVSEDELPIPNSKNLFGVGPEAFVSLIAHADTVLTNSFHASVFSVLFRSPFRVFATDESSSRMTGFLDGLELASCCCASVDPSPIAPVDWGMVQERLTKLREASEGYLRRALS